MSTYIIPTLYPLRTHTCSVPAPYTLRTCSVHAPYRATRATGFIPSLLHYCFWLIVLTYVPYTLHCRSPGPISLNVWHRVDVARNNRHGTMVIDAETTVRGHSRV